MEAWQSWFNAPDLKSDVGASLPGVRIPALPPVRGLFLEIGTVHFLWKEPRGKGFDYKRKADVSMPFAKGNTRSATE